ncbi:hypothetical protein [Brevundimonas sp. DC300-4]|uniref:hypothetical protein n=1 Tax=Brevundimonas sp. DC300-4 TaxID=2804594 RepID=UPI003CF4AC66
MAVVKGEVGFQVEGEPYKLVLDFNALCDLEDEMPGLMDGTIEIKSPKAIRAVFAAGLAKHHPGLSLTDAGNLIQGVGIEKAGGYVAEAFAASFGGGDKTSSPQ